MNGNNEILSRKSCYPQAKAIEMRAAGKVYKRPKKRQATESAKQDMADPDAKMKNQAKYEDEEGSRPEIDVQVSLRKCPIVICLSLPHGYEFIAWQVRSQNSEIL